MDVVVNKRFIDVLVREIQDKAERLNVDGLDPLMVELVLSYLVERNLIPEIEVKRKFVLDEVYDGMGNGYNKTDVLKNIDLIDGMSYSCGFNICKEHALRFKKRKGMKLMEEVAKKIKQPKTKIPKK